MTVLKQLTALIVLGILCAQAAFAQDGRSEKRTWRVIPRGSHSVPTKRRSNLAELLRQEVTADIDAAETDSTGKVRRQHVEQRANREPTDNELAAEQVQYAEQQLDEPIRAGEMTVAGHHEPVFGGGYCESGCCDIDGCDSIGFKKRRIPLRLRLKVPRQWYVTLGLTIDVE